MRDEIETPRRIIEDCVENELRYNYGEIRLLESIATNDARRADCGLVPLATATGCGLHGHRPALRCPRPEVMAPTNAGPPVHNSKMNPERSGSPSGTPQFSRIAQIGFKRPHREAADHHGQAHSESQ
jgi:hypothetical protein